MGSQRQKHFYPTAVVNEKPEGVVFCCIDYRVWASVLIHFRCELGLNNLYPCFIPAGASPDDFSRENYLPSLLARVLGIARHAGLNKVFGCGHVDCLAHGGSHSFASIQEERKYHLSCMQETFVSLLKQAMYLIEWEGSLAVEFLLATPSCEPAGIWIESVGSELLYPHTSPLLLPYVPQSFTERREHC